MRSAAAAETRCLIHNAFLLSLVRFFISIRYVLRGFHRTLLASPRASGQLTWLEETQARGSRTIRQASKACKSQPPPDDRFRRSAAVRRRRRWLLDSSSLHSPLAFGSSFCDICFRTEFFSRLSERDYGSSVSRREALWGDINAVSRRRHSIGSAAAIEQVKTHFRSLFSPALSLSPSLRLLISVPFHSHHGPRYSRAA